MTRTTLLAAGLLLLAVAVGAPGVTAAQDVPPYQPLEIRHVCSAQPIRRAPGGAEGRMLPAGEAVVLKDITFDRDSKAWFALDYATGKGMERATGFLPVTGLRHFCPDPGAGQGANGLQTYLAPPNTCHLVAGQTDSLAGLGDLAATLPGFLPSAMGYRLTSGGYALSLGLVSTMESGRILSQSQVLPVGAYCASGADFAQALIPDGTGFVAPSGDDATRLATAQALLDAARQGGDPQGMRQACDLGLGPACSGFARYIFDQPDAPGSSPEGVTRYGLLGCMAGQADGCLVAINRQDNTVELARDQSLPGKSGSEGQVTTELAKQLCDRQDRIGCILLARNTAAGRTPSPSEAASSFAANLTACQQGITWVCETLADEFQAVTTARGASRTPDERFALAEIEAETCTPGPRAPNQRECRSAYYGYRDFLNYGNAASLDQARAARAISFLNGGCKAGDPAACITLAGLAKFLPEPERREAAARVITLCHGLSGQDSVCDNPGAVLDPTLPEAAPALPAEYARRSQLCLAAGEGNYQDCLAALKVAVAQDGGKSVEPMLRQACTPGSIKGCQALAMLYGPEPGQWNGVTIPSRNDPDAWLAALRTGCSAGPDQTGNTCDLLADAMAAEGDGSGALQVRAQACERLMASAGDQTEAWGCYDAVKLALKQKDRLPEALSWAEFTCDAADLSVSPYGCKLLGNMLSQGLGTPADPDRALQAYRRGCFHPRVSTTDGESCLLYGNRLVETVRSGATTIPALTTTYEMDMTAPSALTEASRAYDMGCMDSIAQSCRANAALLEEWSAGTLPHDSHICQVRNAAGQITSEKPCNGFVFYQASDEMKARREQIALDIYVWPDGDRSVTYERNGDWRLNEIRTTPPTDEGATRCWKNPISTRSFCVSPGK